MIRKGHVVYASEGRVTIDVDGMEFLGTGDPVVVSVGADARTVELFEDMFSQVREAQRVEQDRRLKHCQQHGHTWDLFGKDERGLPKVGCRHCRGFLDVMYGQSKTETLT